MKWAIVVMVVMFMVAPAFAAGSHGLFFTWVNPAGTVTANTFYCGTASKTYTMVWVLPSSSGFNWLTTDATNPPVQGTTYYCAVTDTQGGIESDYSLEWSGKFPVVPPAPTGLTAISK